MTLHVRREKKMSIKEKLKEDIRTFQKADYPAPRKHMSLKRCIETITGNPESKISLRDGKAFINIGKREMELIHLYCPDFKDSSTFLFDEYAIIAFTYGKYLITYNLESDTEIGFITIDEENEKGYTAYETEKNYIMKDVIGKGTKRTIDDIIR